MNSGFVGVQKVDISSSGASLPPSDGVHLGIFNHLLAEFNQITRGQIKVPVGHLSELGY